VKLARGNLVALDSVAKNLPAISASSSIGALDHRSSRAARASEDYGTISEIKLMAGTNPAATSVKERRHSGQARSGKNRLVIITN
jgi:hypothetical protein